MQFLQEQRLLGNTSAEIAEWLHTDDRLDKTGIGDFLGESDDFSKEVGILYLFSNFEHCHIFKLA